MPHEVGCLTSFQLLVSPNVDKVHLAAFLILAFVCYLRPSEALSLTTFSVVPVELELSHRAAKITKMI